MSMVIVREKEKERHDYLASLLLLSNIFLSRIERKKIKGTGDGNNLIRDFSTAVLTKLQLDS